VTGASGLAPTGSTRVCAVIGDPVRHSLSPTLHNAAFAACGLDAVYVAFPVAAGDGTAAVQAMRTLGLTGMSVTMPHKHDAALAVDSLTPQAAALRSCNTVFRDPVDPDRLWGDSTDGEGFVSGLIESEIPVVGKRVVVLGAGGAARAVIDALGRHGAEDIAVINRDAAKADSACLLAPQARIGTAKDVATASLVVNATSLGMRAGDSLPCDPGSLHAGQVVADLIYSPLQTPLLVAAAAVGARTMNGLPMLLHQGALQFERWMQTAAPLAAMRDALSAELHRRSV
jgi:shikimate dehydrogenase